MRACACTNTWIREAYNLGALRIVITMTALTLTPGAASPATHTREPRSRSRTAACVLVLMQVLGALFECQGCVPPHIRKERSDLA